MLSLLRMYDLLLSKGFFKDKKERPLIEYALNLLEEVSKEGGVQVLRLPTGYGKTAITYTSFLDVICSPKFFWRVIHVSPLRSIIDDIYKRANEGFKKSFNCVSEYLEKLMGAQMMFSPGSPYLQKKFTITTFDTFSLSLAKMPVIEVDEIAKGIGYGHFDIPRASIFEALVIMDEVHTFLSEAVGTRATNVLISMLSYLAKSGVPLVLMSATLPKTHAKEVLRKIKSTSHEVRFKEVYYGEGGIIDKDWENEQANKNVKTRILEGGIKDIVKKCLELASNYERVLIVLNTIPRAVEVYRKLEEHLESGKPLMLLHSKFKKKDRDEKLKAIDDEKKWILISTQVIEAGVDISAKALITDLAPANNLVQRIGRVARRTSDDEGIIYIVKDVKEIERGFGIYDINILTATSEELKKNTINNEVKISWRNLESKDGIDYQKFVDSVYSKSNNKYLGLDFTYYRLISSFVWTSVDAIELLINVYNGSFLRNSPIIPLIVGSIDHFDYKTITENSVPLSLDDINGILRKGIKIEKVLKKGGSVKFEELMPREVSHLAREVLTGDLIALRTPQCEVIYTEDEGLVV